MRKVYHSEKEKREAQRTYDRKRQQTEHRREYDRKRRNTDEHNAKRRARMAVKREARSLVPPPVPKNAKQISLFRICPKCEVEKWLSEFPQANRPGGYGGFCKECNRKRTNSEEEKARQREIKRKIRLDPVKGQVIRNRLNKWRREHPKSQQEMTMRRNARKKAATTEHVNYEAILERDGLWCYICKQNILPDQSIDFDHVIPLSRGGTHAETNIKPTHRLCNRRKADKLLEHLSAFDRRGI